MGGVAPEDDLASCQIRSWSSAVSRLQVKGLPSIILFHNGKEVDRVEGVFMKDQLVEWMREHMSTA